LRSSEQKYLDDWSRDGRFLLFSSQNPKTGYDLWVLPASSGNASGNRLNLSPNSSWAQSSMKPKASSLQTGNGLSTHPMKTDLGMFMFGHIRLRLRAVSGRFRAAAELSPVGAGTGKRSYISPARNSWPHRFPPARYSNPIPLSHFSKRRWLSPAATYGLGCGHDRPETPDQCTSGRKHIAADYRSAQLGNGVEEVACSAPGKSARREQRRSRGCAEKSTGSDSLVG
jgi:hypothetical protein